MRSITKRREIFRSIIFVTAMFGRCVAHDVYCSRHRYHHFLIIGLFISPLSFIANDDSCAHNIWAKTIDRTATQEGVAGFINLLEQLLCFNYLCTMKKNHQKVSIRQKFQKSKRGERAV